MTQFISKSSSIVSGNRAGRQRYVSVAVFGLPMPTAKGKCREEIRQPLPLLGRGRELISLPLQSKRCPLIARSVSSTRGSRGLRSTVASKLTPTTLTILVPSSFVVGAYRTKIGSFPTRVWLTARCKSGRGVGSLVRTLMMGIP